MCKKIGFIDYVANHYIQRGIVTLGTKRYENIFQLKLMACEARENILKYFHIEDKEIYKIMSSFYYGALKSAVSNIKSETNISKKEKRQKMKTFITNETVRSIAIKSRQVPLKHKILVLVVRMHLVSILLKI